VIGRATAGPALPAVKGSSRSRSLVSFALPARPAASGAPVLGRKRAGAPTGTARSDDAGAAWTLLLPSLELPFVLCVGLPTAATLRTLADRAGSVRVVCSGGAMRERARTRIEAIGAANVSAASADQASASVARADLAVVTGWRAFMALTTDEALRRAVIDARVAFVGLDGPGWPAGAPARARRASADLGRGVALRLSPGSGEIRAVAADDDVATLEFLERLALSDRGRRSRRLVHGASRRGLLVIPDEDGRRLAPPAYLRAAAAAANVHVDEHRAALSVPNEEEARTGLLHLFAPGATKPEYLVKVARDGRGNAPLHREWRALHRLQDANLAYDDELPRPVFIGHHAGLTVLGMSAVDGAPFHRRTTARADCALARAAVGWLHELGVATIAPPADATRFAGDLRGLLSRFLALYRLTPEHREGVQRHVQALLGASYSVPRVLVHGNPSTANLVVTDGGRPVFVEWGRAEIEGPPLWDLLSFVRSFGVTVARAVGMTDALAAIRRQLLGDLPVNRMLVDAVDRQCVDIGLDRGLVGPLCFMLWMQRAVEEATRLRSDQLDRGHYVGLVRLCLDEGDLPGLQRLFWGQASGAAP
jgi:hypothetical protein